MQVMYSNEGTVPLGGIQEGRQKWHRKTEQYTVETCPVQPVIGLTLACLRVFYAAYLLSKKCC